MSTSFLQDNIYKLIVTGVAAIVVGIIAKWVSERKKSSNKGETSVQNENIVTNTVSINIPLGQDGPESPVANKNSNQSFTGKEHLDKRKRLTNILFIDDDARFKVVSILKRSGWINTKLIKDIDNIDDPDLHQADILFVDIQGVGKALDCKDEGLGLALTLKKKYSKKKIVIYSAESKGDRFHDGLRRADASLYKNAEPYEFQQLIEQFSAEIYPDA